MGRAARMFVADFGAQEGVVAEAVGVAASRLEAAADRMLTTTGESSDGEIVAVTASGKAMKSAESVAAAAAKLGASISKIARQMAAEIGRNAERQASRSDEIAQGMAQVANTIGEVVELIDRVAGRTNFRLSASGDHALAAGTTRTIDDIDRQIQDLQLATAQAEQTVGDAVATINRISAIAGAISSAEEQATAASEIAGRVGQALLGAKQILQDVEGVGRASARVGTAADQVLSSATELTRRTETLRSEVKRCLVGVRHVPRSD